MSEWPIVKLSDVVDLMTGFPFKSKEYSDNGNGHKLLRGDNIVQGRFRWEDVKRWPVSKIIDKHQSYWLKEGDVILAMDRPWIEAGLKYAQITEADLPCLLVQRTSCLRAKNGFDQDFLRYLISSYNFVEYVKLVQTGTAVPHISGKQILNFEFRLPPDDIQSEIGRILRSLDNKIELNCQTNQTLEQIAQAIFKSWFVDFEPVKAKIQAKQNGQDPERAAMCAISGKSLEKLEQLSPETQQQLKTTAALFPDALVESELGEIPEGWKYSEIGNEVAVVGGGTPSTKKPEFWDGGHIHWTTPKDMSNLTDKILLETDRKITEAGLAKISSGLLPENTVLMSSRAPVGYLAIAKNPVAVNQGYIAMKCESELSPEYVMQWAESVMGEIKQRASGTTFAEISKKNFKVIPVIVPYVDVVSEYSKIVSDIYSKVTEVIRETKCLAEARDTFLPKLLSGELELVA